MVDSLVDGFAAGVGRFWFNAAGYLTTKEVFLSRAALTVAGDIHRNHIFWRRLRALRDTLQRGLHRADPDGQGSLTARLAIAQIARLVYPKRPQPTTRS